MQGENGLKNSNHPAGTLRFTSRPSKVAPLSPSCTMLLTTSPQKQIPISQPLDKTSTNDTVMNIKKSITYLAITSMIFTSATMASTIYVTIDTGEVWTYDTSLATGAEIFNSKKVFVTGQNNPNGIAFDADDNAYIVNSNSNEVRVYNRHGSLLRTIGDSNSLLGPSDVTLDSNGNIYVANTQSAVSNERYISKFAADGTFIKWIASPDNNYLTAIGITTDSFDNLYVSFPGGNIAGIVKYTSDVPNGMQGDLSGGDINGVGGLAVDSFGNLLATAALTPGPGGDAIYKFNTSPFPPATYDDFTPGSPFLIDPLGIATSPDGSMFVANTATPGPGDDVSRITKLDANGNPILQWSVGSPEFGRFLAFGPSPVPEPSSVALLGLVGCLSLIFHRRRRIARSMALLQRSSG